MKKIRERQQAPTNGQVQAVDIRARHDEQKRCCWKIRFILQGMSNDLGREPVADLDRMGEHCDTSSAGKPLTWMV